MPACLNILISNLQLTIIANLLFHVHIAQSSLYKLCVIIVKLEEVLVSGPLLY